MIERTRTSTAMLLAPAVAAILLVGAFASAASATESPPQTWWHLNSTSAPTNLPAEGEGQLLLSASNLGYGEVDATGEHVTVTDVLPPGITVQGEPQGVGRNVSCPPDPEHPQTLSCVFAGKLPSDEHLVIRITVKTHDPTGPLVNTVSVTGGHTPPAPVLQKPLRVGPEAPFGIESYEFSPEGETGGFDAQAGSHPFQLTQTLDFNQTLHFDRGSGEEGFFPSAIALPRNLSFRLPPGFAGDPGAVPTCSEAQFSAITEQRANLCPADTAIGVVAVTFNEPITFHLTDFTVPVFNLPPEYGEPARFGFEVENVPIIVRTRVPTGGEYAVEAFIENASQAVQVLSSQVTLWGVPGDPRHDAARGWACLDRGHFAPGAKCEPSSTPEPKAFLTLPTSCEKAPSTGLSVETWSAGGTVPAVKIEEGDPNTIFTFPSALTGCELLPFAPTLSVQPETEHAGTPTGLNVDLKVPQQATVSASAPVAEADVRSTTVALPEGLDLNASAANGLGVCSAELFGFKGVEVEQTKNLSFTAIPPACPDASKVGTVSIETPLLEGQKITGSAYLAQQNTNPFNPPLALYVVAEDKTAGILVKLAGTVTPTATGQLISTFENTPQLPFSDFKLHFFAGERASLSTPPKCGSYRAQTSFESWSGVTVTPESDPPFQVTSGPGASPCADPLPFAPGFTAGAANTQAGALTPFTVTIGHADSDQPLEKINMHLPAGIAALIANVTQCTESQALTDACPPASQVGHTTATAGLGNEPVTLPGQVYLTGALKATASHPAAPFGLLAVTHAAVGPFDLGNVNVLSTLSIDPSTAAVTVTSEPIPKLIEGVPAQLKALQVTVERPGDQPFEFNPTNCDPFSIRGALSGYEGASAPVSYPFQVKNCATLPFKPTLTASTQGKSSKVNGASLTVRVTSSPGQANIAKTTLTLPLALPSRLTTIQKACVAAVFEANPASCPEGSNIGTATVHTPVLKSPVSGPAYLVSHGGAAFPDVEFVLQGEGITLVLDGQTNIKKGITTSTFNAVPDAPVTSFETTLPQGPHSALAANVPEKAKYSLCGTTLAMPTTITGQNGALIEQNTKIAVTGCAAVKSYKVSLAQQLAKALAKCRSTHKRSPSKRTACERKARARYMAMAIAACRRSDRHSSKKRKACEAQARKAYAARRASRR